MKAKKGVLCPAKLALGIATCCGALIASHHTTSAQSARYTSTPTLHSASASPVPTPVVMPSLLMEGRGQIRQSSTPCTSFNCAGTFNATLTGRPFGKANLTLHLSVNPVADELTGCNQATGTGGINNNAYVVNLLGQLCAPGIGYTLSGTVQIYALMAASSTAAVGTLLAFGGTNIPPNPVPNSGPSLVSLSGASGNIPLLLP